MTRGLPAKPLLLPLALSVEPVCLFLSLLGLESRGEGEHNMASGEMVTPAMETDAPLGRTLPTQLAKVQGKVSYLG